MLEFVFVNSSMLSLKTLLMSNNGIMALPVDFFEGMPNLEILNLSGNRLFRYVYR